MISRISYFINIILVAICNSKIDIVTSIVSLSCLGVSKKLSSNHRKEKSQNWECRCGWGLFFNVYVGWGGDVKTSKCSSLVRLPVYVSFFQLYIFVLVHVYVRFVKDLRKCCHSPTPTSTTTSTPTQQKVG